MRTIEVIFWVLLFVVFYSYLGYGIVLYLLVSAKRTFKNKIDSYSADYEPHVTLLIGAYNEIDFVHKKMENSNNLIYPREKLHIIWVTDGSDDGTPEALKKYPDIQVMHEPERSGKIGAINRAMGVVKTPVVIFSDANAMLGPDSVKRIVYLFSDPEVGCVSGEKRILDNGSNDAPNAAEGIYWRYESTLKKWDSELHSVVGAAGELFAIRSELFEKVEKDTLLDDFMISLRIAMKGYKIKYDPEAFAYETASANTQEELKRKIRIAAGGIQSIIRLKPLLNILRYRVLSFQYISHRVLRWTLAPLSLPLILVLNALLIKQGNIYLILAASQAVFYFFSAMGTVFEKHKQKFKVLFVPYYFYIMNYAVFHGIVRYFRKTQTVNWERARRG